MLIAKITVNDMALLLVKPQTFMNNSGVAIAEIANFYKIPQENILIIFDDLDMEFGKIKIKKAGGDAGHNGIKSINSLLGKDYSKLKIGIGRPEYKGQVSDYVLSNFSQEELKSLAQVFDKLCANSDDLIQQEYISLLNKYHANK